MCIGCPAYRKLGPSPRRVSKVMSCFYHRTAHSRPPHMHDAADGADWLSDRCSVAGLYWNQEPPREAAVFVEFGVPANFELVRGLLTGDLLEVTTAIPRRSASRMWARPGSPSVDVLAVTSTSRSVSVARSPSIALGQCRTPSWSAIDPPGRQPPRLRVEGTSQPPANHAKPHEPDPQRAHQATERSCTR